MKKREQNRQNLEQIAQAVDAEIVNLAGAKLISCHPMKKLYSILLLVMFVSVLSAQSGKIRITGKVSDGDTGEPLPGVNIIIEGTTQGTITDIEGN